MRRLLAIAALAIFAAPVMGPAMADVGGALTGNTLILTDGAGRATAYQLGDDGDMSLNASDGRADAGSWAVEGDKVCLTPGGSTFCINVPASVKVGDSWEARGPTGQVSFRVRLAEGMVKP